MQAPVQRSPHKRTVDSPHDFPLPATCPLHTVAPGQLVRVKKLTGSAEMTRRLREMGFCEEARVRLLSRHSQVICLVCNARLGLSERLAQTILVEPLLGQAAGR